jgi:hypothetical protein
MGPSQTAEPPHHRKRDSFRGDDYYVVPTREKDASPNLVGQFLRLEMAPQDAEDLALLSNRALLQMLCGNTGRSSRIDHHDLACDPPRLVQKRMPVRLLENPIDVACEDTLNRRVTQRQCQRVGPYRWNPGYTSEQDAESGSALLEGNS